MTVDEFCRRIEKCPFCSARIVLDTKFMSHFICENDDCLRIVAYTKLRNKKEIDVIYLYSEDEGDIYYSFKDGFLTKGTLDECLGNVSCNNETFFTIVNSYKNIDKYFLLS